MFKLINKCLAWFGFASVNTNNQNFNNDIDEYNEAYWSSLEEEWRDFMRTEDYVSCSTLAEDDWELSYEVCDG